MSYSTTKAIQSYYMGLDFDTADYINKTEVRNWITEFSIIVDNTIRRVYSLPISNQNDLVYLKLIVEKFVVGKIDAILRVSSTDEDKKYLRNRNYTKDANKMLSDLANGNVLLETGVKNIAPIGYLKGNYDD